MADPRAVSITLSDSDRATLTNWIRRRSTAQGLAMRARIVLACAEPCVTNLAVAAKLGVSNLTVGKWRRHFADQGVAGLVDAPSPGSPSSPPGRAERTCHQHDTGEALQRRHPLEHPAASRRNLA